MSPRPAWASLTLACLAGICLTLSCATTDELLAAGDWYRAVDAADWRTLQFATPLPTGPSLPARITSALGDAARAVLAVPNEIDDLE